MNEVDQLKQENEILREKLAQERSKVVDHASQIAALQEQIKLHLQRRFAASNEKLSVNQLGLFNEAESLVSEDEETTSDTSVAVKAHQRTRKPRVSIPDDYPREEIVYDLPENEKICPHDGHELKVIGSDDHEQLDIIPAQVKVLRHKRLKYACPCCDQHIVTAKKPKQAIGKSIASAGLLAYIATQKYCDALPLYRQSEVFKRAGIELDRTNLANWMVRVGELVQLLIQTLAEHLQRQSLLHLDESTLQVLDEPGKPAESKSYLWLMASFKQHPAI